MNAQPAEILRTDMNHDTRIALLEQQNAHNSEILHDIRSELRIISNNIGGIAEKVDGKHVEILNRIDANNKWLFGIGISVLFSMATFCFSFYNTIHAST